MGSPLSSLLLLLPSPHSSSFSALTQPKAQKMQLQWLLLLCTTVFTADLLLPTYGAAFLPHNEVEALREIAQKLGKSNWDFSVDPCDKESGWATITSNNVTCNCSYASNTVCHVISIVLTSQSLPGVLPPELVKLPYLQQLDLQLNYLNGTIPKEWGSMKLQSLALSANQLSGRIPNEIGNITTLKIFGVEFNQLSGVLPSELGNLVNMERMLISSNNFTGPLPESLAKLTSLKDFWINDNRFTGRIPNFIQNWTNLERITIQGSGLEGPIPSSISLLTKMVDMRISDINGIDNAFPALSNMKNLATLILRSCNIVGEIPPYLGSMINLRTLDLSFNKLTGQIPTSLSAMRHDYVYLTGNALTGPVPEWTLTSGQNVDLSYNNFTLESSGSISCQQGNVNLFGSSALESNSSGVIPCLKSFMCPRKSYYSFHINCGGRGVTNGKTKYEDDTNAAGPSTFFMSSSNWAFSSTGNSMDDVNIHSYIDTNISGLVMKDYQLYTNARVSPVSLTYYGLCLLNGNYSVNLHFAEIMFTNDKTYRSIGRRMFDIYIQGKLVQRDFNIADEAGGVGKKVIKKYTAVVTGTTLEIRFYWAGKGTTGIPTRGTYGPLVSAISVVSDFKPPSEERKKILLGLEVGSVLSALILIVMVIGVLWWKGCFGRKRKNGLDLRGLLQTGSITLKQIKAATNDFDSRNKIGEGGFGSVYKGHLSDGTIIAVKQLSSKSKQGNREFVNEIGLISSLQHPNLVKLYGCCVDGSQLLVVYEYMENNSLARPLFGHEECQFKLDWPTRHKICLGIARALAYLHEESILKIVHRDIKATNVLLDKDLNAKVSDFGLAKLDEEENTHIISRVAGTIGYMAPEYATRGYLTDKVDVYSFGIVALEIVSGKKNTHYIANEDCLCLLDWALVLLEKGDSLKLVDPTLESNYVTEEVLRMINVALLCTNKTSTLRPTMSSVVSMLEGQTVAPKFVLTKCDSIDDIKFEAMRQQFKLGHDKSTTSNQTSSMYSTLTGSSTSGSDLYPIIPDSMSQSRERILPFLQST